MGLLLAILLAVEPGAEDTSTPPTSLASRAIWVQPVGAAFFGAQQNAYVAAGVTWEVAPAWSLVGELTYAWFHQSGALDIPGVVSRGTVVTLGLQHLLVQGDLHWDLFVAPKLLLWIFRSSNTREGGYGGPIANPETLAEVGVGVDVGIEWRFAHAYAAAVIGPSLLYSMRRTTGLAPFDNVTFPNDTAANPGLRWGFNLNLLRVGVSF